MKFRTKIQPLTGHSGIIDHRTPLFLLGSCFTDSIGRRLADDAFDVCANPFGTIYNPASMQMLLQRIVDGTPFTEADIVESQGLLHTFFSHSKLSDTDSAKLIDSHNRLLESTARFISGARYAILTFGTARVYTYLPTGTIVANCHKIAASQFQRRLLSVDEAAHSIVSAVKAMKSLNSNLTPIFTVSPIRHLADGLHGNQISKATLLLATEKAAGSLNDAIYFPSYEIVVDDLRDYRFYDSDMKHPSPVAADYIYELFSESFFDRSTRELASQCRGITRRISHRQLNANDPANISFATATETMINQLVDQHPYLKDRFQLLNK